MEVGVKLRFSLRAALLAMSVVAGFVYWRTRPAAVARDVVRAVKNRNCPEAEALLAEDAPRAARGSLAPFVTQRAVGAEVRPQSLGDWLRGECRVHLIVERQNPCGTAYVVVRPVTATAGGLR
jgi:hypothetical protein